jgi:AcrR family transcriptional regulator
METHRTVRGAARVRSLTDTAAQMFLDHGYEAMSLDTLIARVGGSRRNIYGRFGGKEGMFIEVVTRFCTDLARPLEELEISGEEVGSALALFGCRLLDIVLQQRTVALHRLMIAESQRFPELAQAMFRAGHDNATRILAEWIEHKQSVAQLRGDVSSTELAAHFVNLLITGPQLRALVGLVPGPLDGAEIASLTDIAVETFLSGALPRESKIDA